MSVFPEPADLHEYLRQSVRIDPIALEEEYVRLPADIAFWNERYAAVYRLYLERRLIARQVEAELSREHREYLTAANKGRVTVGEVEHEVVLDPSYQRAKASEAEAEAEVKRLYGILDALRTKRDMLISLGATIRQEKQNDPVLRAQAAEREVRAWRE